MLTQVFVNAIGEILSPADVAMIVGHDVRIHDLRHSLASALVNEGMTLYDVKELLGHSNMATATRYAHLSNKRLHSVAAVAGQHFGLSGGRPVDAESDTENIIK